MAPQEFFCTLLQTTERQAGNCINRQSLRLFVAPGDEIASGWPFGLENMILRLRNGDALRAVPAGSNSIRLHSTSFSSFSSSDLDTESTRSFFHDRSITLGRLIGIKPGEGDLYFPTSFHFAGKDSLSVINAEPISPEAPEVTMCHSVCIPVIWDVLEKMSPSRHDTTRTCSEVD